VHEQLKHDLKCIVGTSGKTGYNELSQLKRHSNWAFTRYDRRTDQSDRPVGPTGRSDDRTV